VLTYTEVTTRVTVEITPLGPQSCEVTVTHDLGNSDQARANEETSRKGWTTMLALMERELFPRRIGIGL
jgi:hypothetical protein